MDTGTQSYQCPPEREGEPVPQSLRWPQVQEASEALMLPDGAPGGANSLQALPTPRLRRAPGQRPRGQGGGADRMHLPQLAFIRGRGRGSRVPRTPAQALSGRSPQSVHLGDKADVCLTEREGEEVEQKGTERGKCLHLFYQSLVSHISPAAPGKEATD